jgi:hypothetical protein
MAELAGKDVTIKISGAATSMTGEATTTEDDQVYQIAAATKRVLDKDTAPTVLDDGVETEESYTVNYLSGKITFEDVDEERGPITVTGKYLPMTTAAYANDMSHSRNCDLLDANKFGLTHKNRIAGLKSASGVLGHIDLTDTTYITALEAGDPVVIEIVAGSGIEPTRYWAMLESEELKAALAGVQNATVTWSSKNKWIVLGN